jgi:3-oxoacyl-[acyl-carrier-protein] synthase II
LNRRVVITGLGLVTPVGIGVEASWKELCAGRSGIGEITRFDASAFATRIAGEVKDFRPQDFLPKKEARRTSLFIAYAIAATRMAMESSGLQINANNADRVGVLTGCGLGGLSILEEITRVVDNKGPNRVTPFFIPMMIGNMAPGMISIHFGAKGPNASMATACAAGSHAIGDAYRIIQRGDADAMIAGGVESTIAPTGVAGFISMKALSTRNDEPQKASRPFDRDRDGFVIGEGSGILILESLDNALERGADIYAEVAGYGMSGDAYHMTSPPPDGGGAIRCIQAALTDAGFSNQDIDYINAHGTSTPLNDLYETRAIKNVFQEKAYDIPVSSTKSMTGHLLGGAGGVEAVFSVLAIQDSIIPPTINYDNADDECDLDYVPNVARKQTISTAMSNSFGFGGTNACLIFKKFIA